MRERDKPGLGKRSNCSRGLTHWGRQNYDVAWCLVGGQTVSSPELVEEAADSNYLQPLCVLLYEWG